MRKKELAEKIITKYLYTRFVVELSKATIKNIDGITELKLKDRDLQGEALANLVLETTDKNLVENKIFGEAFKERLIAILDIIDHIPENKNGKNKIKAKKTTEFKDFKNIVEKQCDKIVFYPKGKKAIVFTNPLLIKVIIDSMALPSAQFENIKNDYPHLVSEVDLMEIADNFEATFYSQCVVLLRDEVHQIFNKHPKAFINLVTYELLEIAGTEQSNKTDKAKISYIEKKYINSGNQK
jgi:hypothetical protein